MMCPTSSVVGRVFRRGKIFAIRGVTMSRPRRIPGYAYLGVQRYFLTICTDRRQEFFRDDKAATMVIEQFLRTASEHDVAIVAYCVMPDHMHLLVDGLDDGAELLPFVKLAKQRAGYQFKQEHGNVLWQKGYYEHVLRDEEQTEDVVLYIIANPVRKQLVLHILEYPYWGSSQYSRDELLHSIGLRSASRD
jgi:putative transposase